MLSLVSSGASDLSRARGAIEDRIIPGGPRGRIALRILRPRAAAGPLAVVMYFHGGGWILRDEETHERLMREIADGAQAAVVFLDYDRSLEVSSAVAIEEAYAATRWVALNGGAIGVDANRLAVAGDSLGGNLSAAVALLAKERGGPRISAQVLFYPVADADTRGGSAPVASPLHAPVDRLRGLPPALVITSGLDTQRLAGEAYADRLIAAGVTVTFSRYLGVLHDFLALSTAGCSAARAAIAQANAMLRQTLAS